MPKSREAEPKKPAEDPKEIMRKQYSDTRHELYGAIDILHQLKDFSERIGAYGEEIEEMKQMLKDIGSNEIQILNNYELDKITELEVQHIKNRLDDFEEKVKLFDKRVQMIAKRDEKLVLREKDRGALVKWQPETKPVKPVEPEPPIEPVEPEPPKVKKKLKLKVGVADIGQIVKEKSRDQANVDTSATKKQGFFKRIWNAVTIDYRRAKLSKEKELEAVRTGNIFVGERGAKEESEREKISIAGRFASEMAGLIQGKVDSKGREVGELAGKLENTPEEQQIKQEIEEVIRAFATRDLNDVAIMADFEEAKKRIFERVTTAKRNLLDNGNIYADNIIEIIKQVQVAIREGQALDELQLDVDVTVGRARSGLKTKEKLNWAERGFDWASKKGITKFVNEAVLAGALNMAYSIVTKGSQAVARSKWVAGGTFGASLALGGVFGFVREGHALEKDRAQHARERAAGRGFDRETAGKRREKIERHRYDMKTAEQLTVDLESRLYVNPATREVRALTETGLQQVIEAISEIEARINLCNNKDIDLISYADTKHVESQNCKLLILKEQAKLDLARQLATQGSNMNVDAHIRQIAAVREGVLLTSEGGINERDKAFARMKAWEQTKSAARGIAIGAAVGTAIRGAYSLASHAWHGAGWDSFARTGSDIKSMWTFSGGEATEKFTGFHKTVVGGHEYTLPNNYDLVPGTKGALNLVHDGKVLVGGLPTNPDGSLSQKGLDMLANNRVLSADISHYTSRIVEKPQLVDPGDYIKHHPGEFHQVARTWYENDTPKPDFNELKLWLGGAHNTGYDAAGNVVHTMHAMDKFGSWHKDLWVDPHKALSMGKLRMVYTLSHSTEGHAVVETFDLGKSTSTLDRLRDITKVLFKNVNGHAQFQGAHVEIAQYMGKDAHGVEIYRSLSTYSGPGLEKVTDTIRETVNTVCPKTILVDTAVDNLYDAPAIVPLPEREILEKEDKEQKGKQEERPTPPKKKEARVRKDKTAPADNERVEEVKKELRDAIQEIDNAKKQGGQRVVKSEQEISSAPVAPETIILTEPVSGGKAKKEKTISRQDQIDAEVRRATSVAGFDDQAVEEAIKQNRIKKEKEIKDEQKARTIVDKVKKKWSDRKTQNDFSKAFLLEIQNKKLDSISPGRNMEIAMSMVGFEDEDGYAFTDAKIDKSMREKMIREIERAINKALHTDLRVTTDSNKTEALKNLNQAVSVIQQYFKQRAE